MPLHRRTSRKCHSTGKVTARLLLGFLALSITASADISPILPPSIPNQDSPSSHSQDHVFTLRHVFHYGDLNRPANHLRLDVPKDASAMWMETEEGKFEESTRPLVVRSNPQKIHRLKDRRPSVVDPMVAAARQYSDVWASSPDLWTMDEVNGPDVRDAETIHTFAQMAANAYVPVPDTGDWKDVNGGFNRTNDVGFGWNGTGLRGHLYVNEKNDTIVIGLKGTSLAMWDGEGTTRNDKENDNLFFSCCCGQQGSSLYRQVCDCAAGTYTCNLTCIKKSLKKENRYYSAARYLYNNVTALYPDAEIWMSGHSLGGSVSAMVGLTYGHPTLTFQSVPDALPANRLGLPVPPGVDPDRPGQREYTGAYHFGHNSDPIFMGTCNGATATCSYFGYALESSCHTGRECIWDTVNTNGTRVSIITHRIIWVIDNVIKKWTTVPECKFTSECVDCPLWKEVTGNSSKTSTSAPPTSTQTRTRTTTCQTPGWWGCLDETTTSDGSTTTSETTTTTSTSTCKTPGWFGCNDETTTTEPVTSTSSIYTTPTITSPASTATCETPGWFGCNDPSQKSSTSIISTTSTQSHPITSPPPAPTSTAPSPTTHSCTSSEWFGLICVDPSPIPSDPPKGKTHCVRRSWFGFCKEWGDMNYEWKEDI